LSDWISAESKNRGEKARARKEVLRILTIFMTFLLHYM
jgi:hypothetical protein